MARYRVSAFPVGTANGNNGGSFGRTRTGSSRLTWAVRRRTGRSCLRPSQKVAERGGGILTETSSPMASTPNMPRAAAKTDPGPRCGRVTSIGSNQRENNGPGPQRGLWLKKPTAWFQTRVTLSSAELPYNRLLCRSAVQSISIRISSRPRLSITPSCVPFRCSTTPAALCSHKSLAPDLTKPGPPLLCVYSPFKSEMLRKL